MSRASLAFPAILLLAVLASTQAVAAAPDEPAATPDAVAPTPAPANPMMAAIDAALQAERVQVADLAAQLATAPDDATALALHRAIEQAKSDAQRRVLVIQAEYARLEGRVDDAARIEAAIAAMGRVDVPANVEQRPAPDNAATGR